jgi:hypothetical protein
MSSTNNFRLTKINGTHRCRYLHLHRGDILSTRTIISGKPEFALAIHVNRSLSISAVLSSRSVHLRSSSGLVVFARGATNMEPTWTCTPPRHGIAGDPHVPGVLELKQTCSDSSQCRNTAVLAAHQRVTSKSERQVCAKR